MGKVISPRWPYFLVGIWIFLIMGLGVWWLYLIVYLGNAFNQMNAVSPEFSRNINFVYMVKWEGLAFFILLMLVSFFLLFIYLQDLKKAKATEAFFASVTHELKTPLTSIRLQAEVMKDLLDSKEMGPSSPSMEIQFTDLVGRLLEDTQKLESELEKILQLSRMERGGNLNPVPIDLIHSLQNFMRKENKGLEFSLEYSSPQISILADEYALKLIMRNLVENTLKHRPIASVKKAILLRLQESGNEVHLHYDDQGGPFGGDPKRLGNLFYTYRSHRSIGSGIGLYLIRKLMRRMNGEFIIVTTPHLKFTLVFPKPEGERQNEEPAK